MKKSLGENAEKNNEDFGVHKEHATKKESIS